MTRTPEESPATGIAGRLAALGVFALCAAALVYVHRSDIWPAAAPAKVENTAFARCFEDSTAKIDTMRAEGLIDAAMARGFRDRAEARCRAQTGGASGPPARPAGR